MLDTVALTLREGGFVIAERDRFSPNAEVLYQDAKTVFGKRHFIKFVQNHTPKELAAGKYKPRLTLYGRLAGSAIIRTLRVEFSAPKLLLGNNFDELTDQDFERLLERLKASLKEMGVWVRMEALRNADVSAIHFSKNLAFTDYTTCSMVLNEVNKANLFTRLDLNRTDFRNGGHAIKFHANSYEVVLYDKLLDLAQSKKSEARAVERDNAVQRRLFEPELHKPLEVLRIEIRLNTRQKIKQVLKRVGSDKPATFSRLYDGRLAKVVLSDYWQTIESALKIHRLQNVSVMELFELLRKENPAVPASTLQRLHSTILCQKSGGNRRLRLALGYTGKKNSSWSRLIASLTKLNLPEADHFKPSVEVRKALALFKPLRVNDYKCDHNGGK